MPMALERLEEGIYILQVAGVSGYDDALMIQQDAQRYRVETNEHYQVFIIERAMDAVVQLSFVEIRNLVARSNTNQYHFLHIDTSVRNRLMVLAINRITPLNIILVPNRESALQTAREILSNYSPDN